MAAELRPLTLSTEADSTLRLRESGFSLTSGAERLRLRRPYKVYHLDAAEAASLQAGVTALGGDFVVSDNHAEAIFTVAEGDFDTLIAHVEAHPALAHELRLLAGDVSGRPSWSAHDGRSLLNRHGTTIMGVLNVTPDSFSDGGRYVDPAVAEEHALRMVAEGAHIIDVGGLSTRPGSRPIPVDEEIARTLPVIQRLATRLDVPLSIDTYHAPVAAKALAAGATIVNDVSGLTFDEEMATVCARAGAAVVLMHTSAAPEVMMQHTHYPDMIRDIREALRHSMRQALEAGISEERIALDPGFGFGKTAEQGWDLLRRLGEFRGTGRPLLIGLSRKSFFAPILGGDRPPAERDVASGMAAAAAVLRGGADIVRTHNVSITRDCLAVADQLLMPPGP